MLGTLASRPILAGALAMLVACGQDRPAAEPKTTADASVEPSRPDDAPAMDAGTSEPLRAADGGPLRTPHLVDTRLRITQRVFFTPRSSAITKPGAELLDETARVLKDHPEIQGLSIEGHASGEGDATTSQKLSEARAGAVVDTLVKKGTPRAMLTAVGHADARPLTPPTNEEARQRNRRVELVVTPEVVAP